MIFSHIADTHLGLVQYGLEEREEDVYRVFNQAIDISIQDHVDFVIFSGDIFHVPNPNGTAIVQMANALKKLTENNIDSFFILGEHDISRISTTPIHFVYHNLNFSKYIGNSTPFEYRDVLLCGFDKIRKNEIPKYEDKFNEVNNAAKNHKGHKILVMHQGITEFNKFAGELLSTDMPADFTYYAMGHLHDHDIKNFRHLGGPVAYPGSIEMTSNEGTKNTKKGFIEVDISTSEAKTNRIELDNRPHYSHQLDYDNLDSSIDKILDSIKEGEPKPMIDLQIRGRQIKPEQIQAQVSRLNESSLRCAWRVISQEESDASVLLKRPSKIDDELLRLSTNAVGSKIANFAIQDLLPVLSSGQVPESAKLILENFEKFKKEKETNDTVR